MRFAVAACLAALAACYANDDRRKVSSGGPGGGGGTSFAPDAPPLVDMAPSIIQGKVCTATDLRTPFTCTQLPGPGLPVSDLVSGVATTTTVDSTFALAIAGETSALVDVETGGDTTIAPSVQNVANNGQLAIVAVADTTMLNNLAVALGSPVGNGQGVLVLFVQNTGGVGQPGWVATPPPGFLNNVFYDDATAVGWGTSGTTGTLGAVLMMGVTAGTYNIALSNERLAIQTSVTVRIVDGHVTFATTTINP